METRQSIDECSGEEWNAAAKGHWDFLRENKYKDVYEEDPVYSKDSIFEGKLFDQADESEVEDDPQADRSVIEDWLRQEEILDEVVKCLGDWEAIAYCHGTILRILLDSKNVTNTKALDVARRHIDRLYRLVNETQGINW